MNGLGRIFQQRYRNRSGQLCTTKTWYIGYRVRRGAPLHTEPVGSTRKGDAKTCWRNAWLATGDSQQQSPSTTSWSSCWLTIVGTGATRRIGWSERSPIWLRDSAA